MELTSKGAEEEASDRQAQAQCSSGIGRCQLMHFNFNSLRFQSIESVFDSEHHQTQQCRGEQTITNSSEKKGLCAFAMLD